jgi:hypothetical protein
VRWRCPGPVRQRIPNLLNVVERHRGLLVPQRLWSLLVSQVALFIFVDGM